MANPRRPKPLGDLPDLLIAHHVAVALEEDLGRAGDITTDAIVSPDARAQAAIRAREGGVLAGLQLARAAFQALDRDAEFSSRFADGAAIAPGDAAAEIAGTARALLTAERTALNYLCHLSGIATATRRFVDAVAGTAAKICCTRKTTPGLRALEKYAVRMGGGSNHRYGLDDAILIKDNHIAAAGGIAPAIRAARARAGHLVKIEIEVDTLEQLDQVLREPVDIVMLDNMDLEMLAEAVRRVGGTMRTEASGGVRADAVRQIAETGVDLISVGALTHSAPALDLGLDLSR